MEIERFTNHDLFIINGNECRYLHKGRVIALQKDKQITLDEVYYNLKEFKFLLNFLDIDSIRRLEKSIQNGFYDIANLN